ncbi:helix-turn-helix transcriptional regulator [Microcoleus sp. FACHB-1515]|uniref:helix-turn-helix transcriptional regulator n=1 Tax=Cyanophyceae TaxID=3028117 RepID=UPI001687D5DF|nr:AraC family transcriptional regulator [Microcoleus sp. FACHB-1515]MBD2091492.1 helix-turn-helix transcriptional regulator [Microcoleus sp. FACHB-1515]
MTLLLSEKELQPAECETCDRTNHDRSGSYELAIASTETNSRGYKRSINLRHGLNLLIRDYWLQDALVEESLSRASGLELEFGFNLFADRSMDEGDSNSCSFLQFGQTKTEDSFQEWQSQSRILKIDLHLTTRDQEVFEDDQLALIPLELREAIAPVNEDWYQPVGSITPAVEVVLQQILNCPYQGSIQQIYLEGKALELIALQTAQFLNTSKNQPTHRLKSSDVERIRQAKELVTNRLENPPSLLELARLVGLNDCTLKRGFRQTFGTTVFGYIRQQRLAKAQQLLLETEMNVAEVACAVGYSHPGNFAAAFKQEFGISPKAFSRSVW